LQGKWQHSGSKRKESPKSSIAGACSHALFIEIRQQQGK